MKLLRRWLILIHRYLGIGLGALFFVWFLSGIGMTFAKEMPSLTPEFRLRRLPPIDFSQIRLTAAEAALRAEGESAPTEERPAIGRITVGAILDRPVYRIGGRSGSSIVYADDGSVLGAVDAAMAKAIAARFVRVSEDKLKYSFITEADQWTLEDRRQLPLHKFDVDDASRTQLYVSPGSGEVVILTTRGTRALAWVSAIPHWLYFRALRVNDEWWTRAIIWTSGVGCFLALIGIILGLVQFRRLRPHVPYSGLMRWHYLTGAVFGIFTLTWVFSGLLSMDPWEWISGDDLAIRRDAFTGGPLDVAQFPPFDASGWSKLLAGRQAKEIDFTRIQGAPYYTVRLENSERLLVAAGALEIRREPFSVDSLMERLKEAAPDAHIVESRLLTDYDSYYYAQDDQRPLPILRAKFDDPKSTWVYIDPMMGRIVGRLHRGDRIQRWLYHGFHSLDFAFWYRNRAAWQIGTIALCIGGASLAGIGLWLGVRRVGRGLRRLL
jgi:uncharacterized iron-regulated membrane protein